MKKMKNEKIIAIKVDEETWKKWKELNKLNNIATDKTRKYIERLLEEYSWWFAEKEVIIEGKEIGGEVKFLNEEENLDKVTAREILSEI